MMQPQDYEQRAMPDLLRDLAGADPKDLPGVTPGDVLPHGLFRRWLRGGSSLATRGPLASTLPESTRLPEDHPEVDVPGVVLEQFIGGGGQGWVYAGRVRATGKIVAVKVVSKGTSGDPYGWGAREAILCARVRHRNVLRVLRTEPVGAFWVVMTELVQGDELPNGAMEPAEARLCFAQLADALNALARSRLVHRDIKPANILLRAPDRSPVLIDFGLAIDLNEAANGEAELSGTPYFMAPEAWQDGAPDPSWDAYALGVTAAVALVGAPSVRTDLSSICRAKLDGSFEQAIARALSEIPDLELRQWVTGLLDRDALKRCQTLEAARVWLAV